MEAVRGKPGVVLEIGRRIDLQSPENQQRLVEAVRHCAYRRCHAKCFRHLLLEDGIAGDDECAGDERQKHYPEGVMNGIQGLISPQVVLTNIEATTCLSLTFST